MVPAEKLQDRIAYPPRGLRSERAAAYVGLSETTFLRMVEEGTMPQPIRPRGVTVWDRFDLDAAFDNLKDNDAQNTVHRILRERPNVKEAIGLPEPKNRKG